MNHIRAALPDIKTRISTLLQKYTMELTSMENIPGSDGSPNNVLLAVITEFTQDYRSVLDGQNTELCTTELNGGARISFIFHELFTNAIMSMDPLDNVREVDIRTLLYNTAVINNQTKIDKINFKRFVLHDCLFCSFVRVGIGTEFVCRDSCL